MAQIDVHRLPDGLPAADLQTDLIGLDAPRIVAPLRDVGRHAVFPGLTPLVAVEGRSLVAQVQDLAAVPGAVLGPRVASVADRQDELMRALDILTRGC